MIFFIRIVGILVQIFLSAFIFKYEGNQALVLYGFLAGVMNFSRLSDFGIGYILRLNGKFLDRTTLMRVVLLIILCSIVTVVVLHNYIGVFNISVQKWVVYLPVITGGLMFTENIYLNRYKDHLVYSINPISSSLALFLGVLTEQSVVPLYFIFLFLCWSIATLYEFLRVDRKETILTTRQLWIQMKGFSLSAIANSLSAMSTTSLVQILLPVSADPKFVAGYLLLVKPAQSFRTLYLVAVQRFWTNINHGRNGFPIQVMGNLQIKSKRSSEYIAIILLFLGLLTWWLICVNIIGLRTNQHFHLVLFIFISFSFLILSELKITQAMIGGQVASQGKAGILSLFVVLGIFFFVQKSPWAGWFVLIIPLINRLFKLIATREH